MYREKELKYNISLIVSIRENIPSIFINVNENMVAPYRTFIYYHLYNINVQHQELGR